MDTEHFLLLMKKRQGKKTNRDFSSELGISPQYLTDIYKRRREISESLAQSFGFTRIVSIEKEK